MDFSDLPHLRQRQVASSISMAWQIGLHCVMVIFGPDCTASAAIDAKEAISMSLRLISWLMPYSPPSNLALRLQYIFRSRS